MPDNTPLPNWLPPILNPNEFPTIIEFIKHLYCIFENDFMDPNNPLIFNNKIVKYSLLKLYTRCEKLQAKGFLNCRNVHYNCTNCPYVEKEDIFNHITCKDFNKNSKNQIRTPGIFEEARAVRIHWIKHIINNYKQIEVYYYQDFDVAENALNHCFWLKEQKYFVVIREDEKGKLFLTTAYYLYDRKGTSRIRKAYKKYCRFLKENAKKTPIT